MKQFLGALLILAVVPAQVMAGNSCNVTFNGGLYITDSAVTFSESKQLRYKIQGRSLWVENHQVALTQAQSDQVQGYGDAIKALVPQAHQLASEGVAIASDAVAMVLQEFSGKDTSLKVRQQFSLLQSDIDQRFQLSKGFALGEGENGDVTFPGVHELGSAFESNMQTIMEDMGRDISWQVMQKLGLSLFSGKGVADFEAHMDSFGKQMEAAMNTRAQKLEGQAQQLCVSMVALDQRERQLKDAIPELKNYDFIRVTQATAGR